MSDSRNRPRALVSISTKDSNSWSTFFFCIPPTPDLWIRRWFYSFTIWYNHSQTKQLPPLHYNLPFPFIIWVKSPWTLLRWWMMESNTKAQVPWEQRTEDQGEGWQTVTQWFRWVILGSRSPRLSRNHHRVHLCWGRKRLGRDCLPNSLDQWWSPALQLWLWMRAMIHYSSSKLWVNTEI